MNVAVKAPLAMGAVDNDWWRGAVIYQIYPRSFQDSNGDGVGDLAGIVQRLPYIATLGVDAIWISPFFTSPMKDFGYDVSDYCDVDPMFGTLADFDAVVETAHRLGIRVMIDLVLSHTSDVHPWFVESRANRVNDRSDWYVWAEPKPDGTPPNNWLSIFGGSAWQWDTRREQYYLHNFLVSQPDLNFHNMDVQDALLDVATFWLNRGVDGFRLDTINFYFHDAELRDNPALPPERRNADTAPAVNPYNHQEHIYSKNRPENLDFLRKLRAVMEPFGAAAVGEVGDAQRGLEIMGEYTAGDDLMQMCYAFEFLSPEQPTAARIVEVMTRIDDVAADGWACWAFSNHDVKRHASRWDYRLPHSACLPRCLCVCVGRCVCIRAKSLGCQRPMLPLKTCRTPTALSFGQSLKAVMGAAPQWCGSRPTKMVPLRRVVLGCLWRPSIWPYQLPRKKMIRLLCCTIIAAQLLFVRPIQRCRLARMTKWLRRGMWFISPVRMTGCKSFAHSTSAIRRLTWIYLKGPGFQ